MHASMIGPDRVTVYLLLFRARLSNEYLPSAQIIHSASLPTVSVASWKIAG